MDKETLQHLDRKHIWHPFTQMKDYEQREHPIIVRAKGMKLYDIDGNAYYDTISSWWTNLLGHCNCQLNQAIKAQLTKLEHVNFSGFTHPPAIEVVSELKEMLHPSLTKFFFSDNGSTAVEVALKMAFQYWRNLGNVHKDTFLFLDNAYHGDTLGAVSVGGISSYHSLFKPLLFKALKAPAPKCSSCRHRHSKYTLDAANTGCDFQCFKSLQSLVTKHKSRICAVIVEPILQGAGGMLTYPATYLNMLRQLTQQLDILLIYDEVATGFGRTGKMFAYEHSESLPDIICLSKGITGGYLPLAITASTEQVYQAFYDDYEKNKTFFHGHSYTANALACAVAVATLKMLKTKNLPYSNIQAVRHLKELALSFSEFDFISDIRHIGFVLALDIKQSKTYRRVGFEIYQHSLKKGLVLRPLGDTIYYFLPLIVSKAELSDIVRRTKEVLTDVLQS